MILSTWATRKSMRRPHGCVFSRLQIFFKWSAAIPNCLYCEKKHLMNLIAFCNTFSSTSMDWTHWPMINWCQLEHKAMSSTTSSMYWLSLVGCENQFRSHAHFLCIKTDSDSSLPRTKACNRCVWESKRKNVICTTLRLLERWLLTVNLRITLDPELGDFILQAGIDLRTMRSEIEET